MSQKLFLAHNLNMYKEKYFILFKYVKQMCAMCAHIVLLMHARVANHMSWNNCLSDWLAPHMLRPDHSSIQPITTLHLIYCTSLCTCIVHSSYSYCSEFNAAHIVPNNTVLYSFQWILYTVQYTNFLSCHKVYPAIFCIRFS